VVGFRVEIFFALELEFNAIYKTCSEMQTEHPITKQGFTQAIPKYFFFVFELLRQDLFLEL